jgi:hypothetical protein
MEVGKMKKNIEIYTLISLVSLLVAFLAVSASAAGVQGSQGNTDVQSVLVSYNASELIGNTLKDDQGKELGHIDDVVSGPNGRAEYLILSRGMFGTGFYFTPVPLDAANIQIKNGEVYTTLSQEKILNGPRFSGKDWSKLAQNSYDQKIRAYYGQDGPCPPEQ